MRRFSKVKHERIGWHDMAAAAIEIVKVRD
jgi:hypothetical protein